MKISLIGYMGSRKSTVGQLLAEELALPWRDLDKRIEEVSGYTITETILNKGELFFRQLEHDRLLEILQEDKFVLSTGGGTPCYFNNIDELNNHTVSIYLDYSIPELYTTLEGNQADRPLIAHLEGEALREYIAKHLFERAPYYEKATFTIRADNKSTEQIVKEIKQLVL